MPREKVGFASIGVVEVVVAIIAVVAAGSFFLIGNRTVYPQVYLAAEPRQQSVTGQASWHVNDYTIKPVARFEIEALVLRREAYWLHREADLSPVDLALGWGPMSQAKVLAKLSISQGARFYFYSWRNGPPIPADQIVSHSTNLHTVPATPAIAKQIKAIRGGQIVKLKGYLINVEATDGWRWNTSTTRTDSGNGACELMWIEEVSVRTEGGVESGK